MDTTVSMDKLSYSYDDKPVLKEISLQTQRGNVVAVLGPNGAGKSTLFRLIAGLLFPKSGELTLFRTDCRKLYKKRPFISGVCIDGAEPSPKEKVKHIVALESGIIKDLDKKAFLNEMADNKISGSQRYGQLSKGQKRYLLSRLTLSGRRDLILLDEPGDGLDLQKRRELYDLIRDYANTHNATIIIATHILSDIERIADDVVVINDGEIRLKGDLEEIRENYRIIRSYSEDFSTEQLSGVEIVSTTKSSDETTLLAKADYEVWQNIDLDISTEVKPVSLENLYLALTGESGEEEAENE